MRPEVDDLGVDTPEGIIVGEVSYKGHRYPAEIIAHCVWLYHRFPLSLREVEGLMLVRGLMVTYETIRQWCAKFGPVYAAGLRRRQPRPGDTWHLDEVFLTINGRRHYLWRAVDQDGNVLDILVSCRDAKAAKRFFRKLLKRQCTSPRGFLTTTSRSAQPDPQRYSHPRYARATPSRPRKPERAVSNPAFSRSMQKPQTGLASPPCRTPPGQSTGTRQTHPGIIWTPRFRCHLRHFRHVNSESLALAFPIPT